MDWKLIERWAQRIAPITTPDKILASAIIENMAKHFEDWENTIADDVVCSEGNLTRFIENTSLKNSSKNIKITFDYRKGRSRDGDKTDPWHWHPDLAQMKINGVQIHPECGVQIWREYNRLKIVHEKLQQTASQAERNMQENEAKWNLVEQLLGMKRNEQGALVPIVTVEE